MTASYCGRRLLVLPVLKFGGGRGGGELASDWVRVGLLLSGGNGGGSPEGSKCGKVSIDID